MDTPTTIRSAHMADAEKIAALFSRIVGSLEIYSVESREDEIRKFSPDRIAQLIDSDPDAVSVAFRGAEMAGFLITEDQHGPVRIHWYGVNPDFRGLGLGEAILNYLITAASDRKATKIWCDTRTNNIRSISLLEKLDFVRLCEIKNHWHGQNYYLWARDIA
jgi:ribosomal protein S18 acetylase RimI-like enzyme